MAKFSSSLYRICTWLFLIVVVVQVFLAGLTVVARQTDWELHRTLGHMPELLLLLMLITMYTGKASAKVKRTTWILVVVFIVQVSLVMLRTSAIVPVLYLSAFHPVLALIDFWLGVKLLREGSVGAAAPA